MPSSSWTPVPLLPAAVLKDTLAFWEALGFAATYHQKAPYPYAVVERDGAVLHFIQMKGFKPETNTSHGCLMQVDDAGAVHADFAARLKKALGKVPSAGLPRISRWREGGTRFTLTDVAGNWVIVISRGEKDQKVWEEVDDASRSPLRAAMAKAVRFRDYKLDTRTALGVLNVALKKAGSDDPAFAEAEALRASLAAELAEDA